MFIAAVKTTSNVSETEPWLCSRSAGRAAVGVRRGSGPCCPNLDSCCSRQRFSVTAPGRHAHHCTRLSTGMIVNLHSEYTQVSRDYFLIRNQGRKLTRAVGALVQEMSVKFKMRQKQKILRFTRTPVACYPVHILFLAQYSCELISLFSPTDYCRWFTRATAWGKHLQCIVNVKNRTNVVQNTFMQNPRLELSRKWIKFRP